MRTRSFVGVAILGVVIAFLQLLAFTHYLYWEYWWYDVMMHFLGGAFIGGGTLWFLRFEFIKMRAPFFVTAFASVLLVGIAWEIFEYVTGLYNAINYTLDTTLDLAMDIVGMMSAYLVFKRL